MRHREERSDVAISTLGPNDPQLLPPIQFPHPRHREERSDVAISTLGPNDPQLFTPIQFLGGGLAI